MMMGRQVLAPGVQGTGTLSCSMLTCHASARAWLSLVSSAVVALAVRSGTGSEAG